MTFDLTHIHVPDLTGMVVIAGHREFGRGNFADVWKGTYFQGHKQYIVAVKILRSAFLSGQRLAAKTRRVCGPFTSRLFLLHSLAFQKIAREAKLWSTLNHPNVARFIGVWYYQEPGGYCTPRIISVFYERRTLKDNLGYIQSDHQRLKLLRQFLSGLAYLHHKNVIHGDIKPTNILLDDNFNAVLTDFGLSRVLEAAGFTTTSTQAPGTFRYMARELMNPPSHSTKAPLPTMQSDIWSAGMTGLEILSGVVPYADIQGDSELIYYICQRWGRPNKAFYPRVSPAQWTMLGACWQDAGMRPSASEFVQYLDRHYPGLQ